MILTEAGLSYKVCAVSTSMKNAVAMAQKYCQDRSIPVLIEGETGTGKEVIARIIHYGDMEERPFIDINCAALNPSLFESELFGYEAGAFTGGLQRGQKGKLDIADGGTLFLDEIGEIPLDMQGKLLRVLQEKEFYRVGGIKKVKTDVRIICATNVNLEKSMKVGAFRKDLYYRLSVGHVTLPPLSKRGEDIIPLANMFLEEFSYKKCKRFKRISKQAQTMLLNYSWPGNVRELRNSIEWATLIYNDSELKPEHLGTLNRHKPHYSKEQTPEPNILNPNNFVLPDNGLDLELLCSRIMLKAVELHKGNISAAARFLGLSRRALSCRLGRARRD